MGVWTRCKARMTLTTSLLGKGCNLLRHANQQCSHVAKLLSKLQTESGKHMWFRMSEPSVTEACFVASVPQRVLCVCACTEDTHGKVMQGWGEAHLVVADGGVIHSLTSCDGRSEIGLLRIRFL